MNAEWTNEGGWPKSEMRDWLNSVFFGLLPQDLSSRILEVEKKTSCWDKISSHARAMCLTVTCDALWLISFKEVYGMLPVYKRNELSHLDVYDTEGAQYQFYANNDASVTKSEPCQKCGADYLWWLRSPCASGSYGFLYVNGDGDWDRGYANSGCGVSPGFCF